MAATMLVYRVADSDLARYSPQQMANPEGKNGEIPGTLLVPILNLIRYNTVLNIMGGFSPQSAQRSQR
jgi:hypothetical protein